MAISRRENRTTAGATALGLVALTFGFTAHGGDRTDGAPPGAPDEKPAPDGLQTARNTVIEIRSYNLVPGARAEFHRLVVQESMPLLRHWNVDVVGYGPSLHDETSYYLVRAFESLEQRESGEAEFYASPEWVEGPRVAILALIESYTTVVVELDDDALASLRTALPPAP
jgi:hypothetical protein